MPRHSTLNADRVMLQQLDWSNMSTLAIVLAQSVALDHYAQVGRQTGCRTCWTARCKLQAEGCQGTACCCLEAVFLWRLHQCAGPRVCLSTPCICRRRWVVQRQPAAARQEGRVPGALFAEHCGPSAATLLQVAESMLQTFLEYNSSMAKTGDFRDVHKEDLLRVGTPLQWCSRAPWCSVAAL